MLPVSSDMCLTRIAAGCALLAALALPQALRAANNRITGAIDNHRRVMLSGNVTPRTLSAIDQGSMDASAVLPYVTLVLIPSASQQADLDQLLKEQQDPSSPNYHHWLTPEQFAERFGVSQADIDKITAWLTQQGFTVKSVARGRNAISFSGTAAQVQSAFAVSMHRYLANGKTHYANATPPAIPAALQGVVGAIRGLNDFRMRPHLRTMASPRQTLSDGEHQLAPDDVATIYDITPLYKAGIDGTGQTIVVAGQTDLVLSDIAKYRSIYSLPANVPKTMLVPGTQDPGLSSGDLGEADLDIELAGAVARNATILFVYSADVTDALQYAIDQDLAPIISISYGFCEAEAAPSDEQTLDTWGTQANAEGITIFAASGDAGAADCFFPPTDLNGSLSVDLPAGTPEVTGIGGTEFNEGSGSYWNTVNSSTLASALSYIPEMAWNDSVTDGQPSASGGGVSTYFTKPSWQTGTGVPADGKRDVPDVSISGSADHDGYETISGGRNQIVGGTSAGPPQFAGVAALLNQYLIANGFQSSAGLGNINPTLYALAPVTGVFHDITIGNNKVTPCTHACTLPAIGYNAGVGYDLVTGLGTPDVYNLVMAWHNSGVRGKGTVTLAVTASPISLTFSSTTVLKATVTSADSGTPTGTVTFSVGTYELGTATLSGSSGKATATLNVGGLQLAVGANSITAQYGGDDSYFGATGSVSVTVTSAANGPPVVSGMSNGASFTSALAPGGILSIFGTGLAPATASAPGLPLPTMLAGTAVTIDGVPAPLYYVSATQLNVQIPYEVPANAVAVRVNNNGESFFSSFHVGATAPAIFTFDGGAPVPFTTAARGQVISLYMTGAGPVSPAVATGAAPAAGTPVADLPAPVASVSLTVGGADATIDFIGIPTWSVGVVQINYTVPATAPLGAQKVVMTVGGVASAAATLTVTQ